MFSKGFTLAELLAYIEEAKMDEDVAREFKLTDLARLYFKQLKQLGAMYSLPSTQIWEILFVKYTRKILIMKPSVLHRQPR